MRRLDRTAVAVASFVDALPADYYDVRLVPADGSGPVETRRLDRAGVMAALPWLRARNAGGCHVYARPIAICHILVDDLSQDAVRSLLQVHRPAALVETSPGSHQAWITVTAHDLRPERASALARLLARRLGGDAGAANAVQLGRLPGLTNRKPVRKRGDGSYPFALLRWAEARVDAAADALLASLPIADTRDACDAVAGTIPDLSDLAEVARSQEQLRRILGVTALDRSRADFAVARRSLALGHSRERAVALVLAGDRARGMSTTAAFDYAARTVGAAVRSS